MNTGKGVLGTNMYAYCNNDPVNFSDPSGTDSFSDLAKTGFGSLWLYNLIYDTARGMAQLFDIYDSKQFFDSFELTTLAVDEKLYHGAVHFSHNDVGYVYEFIIGSPLALALYGGHLNDDYQSPTEMRQEGALGLIGDAKGFIGNAALAEDVGSVGVNLLKLFSSRGNMSLGTFLRRAADEHGARRDDMWVFIPLELRTAGKYLPGRTMYNTAGVHSYIPGGVAYHSLWNWTAWVK